MIMHMSNRLRARYRDRDRYHDQPLARGQGSRSAAHMNGLPALRGGAGRGRYRCCSDTDIDVARARAFDQYVEFAFWKRDVRLIESECDAIASGLQTR